MFNINVAARFKILTLIFYDLVFLSSNCFQGLSADDTCRQELFSGRISLGFRSRKPSAVIVNHLLFSLHIKYQILSSGDNLVKPFVSESDLTKTRHLVIHIRLRFSLLFNVAHIIFSRKKYSIHVSIYGIRLFSAHCLNHTCKYIIFA